MLVEGPVAIAAQNDQVPVEFFAQILVGSVVNVERDLVPITELTPVIRLVQLPHPTASPFWCLQILLIGHASQIEEPLLILAFLPPPLFAPTFFPLLGAILAVKPRVEILSEKLGGAMEHGQRLAHLLEVCSAL